jgi:Uma2 family endonuclease
MAAIPQHKMTVDEFLTWSEGNEGRHELWDGHVQVMQSERIGHARIKARVHNALARAISAANVPCEALPDGVAVKVDATTVYEPDAQVYCGPPLPADSLVVETPIIVVEVRSPTTSSVDVGRKLIGYFKIPSVMHYLIVDPATLPLIHHARQSDGAILTRIVPAGPIIMNPPGITVSADQLLLDR